jgi:hypothetical protein
MSNTFMGVDVNGILTLKQSNGTIIPIVTSVPIATNLTNIAGDTTITTAGAFETVILTVESAEARTVRVILDAAGVIDGSTLDLQIVFPALDGLILQVYSTDLFEDPISTFASATASNVTNGSWKFYFLNDAWHLYSTIIPAR